MKRKMISFFIITGVVFCSAGSQDISMYNKELIESGEMKPLPELPGQDKNAYDIITGLLPENESAANYYYTVGVSIMDDKGTVKTIPYESYQLNRNLPEYKDLIVRFQYAIWHYERLDKKWESYRGDPTGKCFTVLLNSKGELIKKYLWR